MGIPNKRQDIFQTDRKETFRDFTKVILKRILGNRFIVTELVRQWLERRLMSAVLKKWWNRTGFH
jgi:hypothetical protein